MAIYDINLDLEEKYVTTIKNIYKYIVIIVVFHLLVHFSKTGKNYNFGFSGDLFNEHFLNTIIIICISVAVYHLIFNELININ